MPAAPTSHVLPVITRHDARLRLHRPLTVAADAPMVPLLQNTYSDAGIETAPTHLT
ncbi:hypothetical protein SCH4B_3415 [Ruegeria sp. TrichCH4B]|nr:hypothetical protein SCH4B_3415 [Ruegeria sp. TrichCH4B]